MSWADVFARWWLPMAEVIHYRRADILDLTLDEFTEAIDYVKGRLSDGG